MSPDKEGRSGENEKHSFWKTLPGLITAIATLLTAITGAYIAIQHGGIDIPTDKSTITPTTQTLNIPPTQTTSIPVTETPTPFPATDNEPYYMLYIIPYVEYDTLQPGEATWVEVIVENQDRDRMQNATVRFEAEDGTFSSGENTITGITDEDGFFVNKWRAPLDDSIRGTQFTINIQVSYPGAPTVRDYVIVKIAP